MGDLVLITSLKDAQSVSRQDLSELYGLRRHVELDFRAIKAVMQMDVRRCKSPLMVEKEVAAHLLAYNLVRSVMAQTPAKWDASRVSSVSKERCSSCGLLSSNCVMAPTPDLTGYARDWLGPLRA